MCKCMPARLPLPQVWDLSGNSFVLLQTIAPDPEHPIDVICFNPDKNQLLTASRRLHLWHNTLAIATTEERAVQAIAPRGHHQPIVSSCYSEPFSLLITADASRIICVWDVNSGQLVYRFEHAIKAPITCMSIDDSGRRLLTGAADGIVRAWNYSSGQLLFQMSAASKGRGRGAGAREEVELPQHHKRSSNRSLGGSRDSSERPWRLGTSDPRRATAALGEEVTACLHIKQAPLDCFVSVGWSRDVALYPNRGYLQTTPEMPGKALGGVRTMQGHNEDVLCAAFCPPMLLWCVRSTTSLRHNPFRWAS